MNDPTRLAAAVLLEEVAGLASNLASRLRGPGDLPPIAVGQLLRPGRRKDESTQTAAARGA
jgi:hypothetical protein